MERCVSQCTRSGSRFQQACLGRLWLCSTAAWNRKVKVLFFLTREASPFPRNVLSCFLCRNRVKVVSSTSVCVFFFFRASKGVAVFFLGGSSCSQTGPGIIGDTARRERERLKREQSQASNSKKDDAVYARAPLDWRPLLSIYYTGLSRLWTEPCCARPTGDPPTSLFMIAASWWERGGVPRSTAPTSTHPTDCPFFCFMA